MLQDRPERQVKAEAGELVLLSQDEGVKGRGTRVGYHHTDSMTLSKKGGGHLVSTLTPIDRPGGALHRFVRGKANLNRTMIWRASSASNHDGPVAPGTALVLVDPQFIAA